MDRSKCLNRGEYLLHEKGNIKVDLQGFILTLFKIAVLRNKDEFLAVLEQLLFTDIPVLRAKILEDRSLKE